MNEVLSGDNHKLHRAKNYEIKTRINNYSQIKKHIKSFQSLCKNSDSFAELQRDIYYKVHSGRLKLRIINNSVGNLIQYQRRETSGKRVSNYTIFTTEDFKTLDQILRTQLSVLTEVNKKREIVICDEVRIHLDKVEGLGLFLEFEVVYKNLNSAKKKMSELIKFFRLNEQDFIKHSYSDMVLSKL